MFGFPRKKADHWTLQPRDLPPEALMLAEPRLRGMEDNPVFRMGVYRRKRGVAQVRAVQFLPTLFIILSNSMTNARAPRLKIAFFVLFVVGLVWLALTGKKKLKTLDPFRLNIERGCRIDLYAAGVSPERVVRGHWGTMLASGRLARERIVHLVVYYLSLAAFGAVLLPLGIPPAVVLGFVLPIHFIIGVMRGYARRPAARGLFMIHTVFRSVREQREWRENWPRALWRFVKRFALIMLIGIGVAIAMAALVIPLARVGMTLKDPAIIYALVGVAALLCAFAGPALGSLGARMIERKTEKYYATAIENCEYLLEILRREEFERARAGEAR